MHGLTYDIAHLLAGFVRPGELHTALSGSAICAAQCLSRCTRSCSLAAVAWQAYVQDASQLYITAAIALVFKAIVIPVALHRMIVKLGIHREIETVGGIGLTMLLGMGLVALAMVVRCAPRRRRSARARGPCLCAGRGSARPADDGDATECGKSGRRLHVA